MKKIYISAALVAALTFSIGCNKVLDFTPTNELGTDKAIKTIGDVQSVLMMSYQQITSNGFLGGAVIRTSEIYGDNISPARLTGNDKSLYTGSSSIFSDIGRGLWSTGYAGVYRANKVIELINVKDFPEATQAQKNQLKGEALFLRAVGHFELLRLFAKPYTSDPINDPGIPLRISAYASTEDAIAKAPRAKVGVVYNQIITDLKAAINLLPTTNGDRATKWAAQAYLSRVLFNKEDYADAYDYANDLITNSGITGGDSITAPFSLSGTAKNYRSNGIIFAAVSSSSADASSAIRGSFWNASASAVYMPLENTGSNSVYNLLLNNGGTRYSKLVATPANEIPYSTKWASATPVNVPLIRLTEMYLTRAEAGLRAGKIDATTAAADVNYVRGLAGLPALTTVTLGDIQAERRVELVMEGDRFHELRRLKQDVKGKPYNSSSYLLKIPDSETSANSSIEQN